MLEQLQTYKKLLEDALRAVGLPIEGLRFFCDDYKYFRNFDLFEFVEYNQHLDIDQGSVDMVCRVETDNMLHLEIRVKSWPHTPGLLMHVHHNGAMPQGTLVPFLDFISKLFSGQQVVLTGYLSNDFLTQIEPSYVKMGVIHRGLSVQYSFYKNY